MWKNVTIGIMAVVVIFLIVASVGYNKALSSVVSENEALKASGAKPEQQNPTR